MNKKNIKTYDDLKVVYAGAGAGKTAGMILEIENAVKNLDENRFLATVTYTNSATNEIKKRLSERIKIPENVFIGTIHSFMIRFFIEPFLNGSNHHLYVEKINDKEIKKMEKSLKEKGIDSLVIKGKKAKFLNEMLERAKEKGIISFDKVTALSKELSRKSNEVKIVSNRLQYIFVDEYQDTSKWQHEMFLNILKRGKTKLFIVGDPNQYIYNFRYGNSQINERQPKILPIKEMKDKCDKKNFKVIEDNYRSSKEIIRFSNNYNPELKQNFEKKEHFKNVKFISSNDPKKISEKLSELKENFDLKNETFILARKWETYNEFSEICTKVKGDVKYSDNIFCELENYIVSITGFNQKKFFKENQLDKLSLRVFAVKVLKESKEQNIIVNKELVKSLYSKIYLKDLKVENEEVTLEPFEVNNDVENESNSYFLTIHKSKGLEAETVLLVAEKKEQLFKWVNATEEDLQNIKNDYYRLGYVAFTRAKKLLVLSCLEELADNEIDALKELNIKSV